MFESWYAWRPSEESTALVDRMREASRSEAQAAARRLVAVAELFETRLRDAGERADWPADTWDAVAGQVSAALRCSLSMASSYLRYAVALRKRLPEVGKIFEAGDIDYRSFQVVVFRTDLITDPEALARVDAIVAQRLSRCPSLTRGRLARDVDRVVALVDRDARRRAREVVQDRFVDVTHAETGVAFVTGTVLATAGRALDRRLDLLAATVCTADPRTHAQRRADALGALAAGSDRLVCGCGSRSCDATERVGPTSVVVHVVADQSTLDGTGTTPGTIIGADGLIPAPLIAEIAKQAALRPLVVPTNLCEPQYVPSARLAAFVRCRDLTCRAPGCDRPAVDCDLDHTVPYRDGGRTHASNLKALCRKHHLLKTFGGWADMQLADGTVIWTLPDGQTYVTTPGSALLFPALCVPTGAADPLPRRRSDVNRMAAMPKRRRTRAQNHDSYIAAERRRNRATRQAEPVPVITGGEPPPF